MIINVRRVLLLAFCGLLLSLELNLNSKPITMSYCNRSIFCSVVLRYRACRTCTGGKSDGRFSSTFRYDCQHSFLLSRLLYDRDMKQKTKTKTHAKLADDKSNTHAHTHA